ncbi:MAG: hypothetical protein Q7V31_17325 [Parvibaculum sp.]|uniref:hypothetical protein n=1 Tax=Parvibaculum sp. TaxID=2024848 RepID=UPI00272611ED|nr:hypothetical protein [Parvibaculum sp.]MDO8840675.1 hypothetical protein [Parvibaculum sp.]
MSILDTLARLTGGYYNSNAFDEEDNPGGFAADGHQQNFPAALADVGDAAEYAGGAAVATGEALEDAQAARDKAEAWADAGEDVPVEEGAFSAKHQRIKTEALKDDVQGLKEDVEGLKGDTQGLRDEAEGFRDDAENIRDSLVNVVELKGSFDASTGTFPADPTVGDYWIVTVSGTVDAVDLIQGDEIIYGPSGWIIVGRVLSASQILTLLLSVDGAGSGLDADLLDGQQGSYYATAAALDTKVTGNGPITGATKTKVTYDAKGLVTAGADAAIADITGLQIALDAKAATATTISAGAGLTGGGSLAANRTLSIATTSNGHGTRTVSTSDPSGGANGDIWLKV